MKTRYLLLFMIFGIVNILPAQSFYDINTINSIEITFQESNWDQILDQYAQAGDEERLMGSVSINGEVFDSVGVRYKGNSTYNANQVKNPLNVKLDYIIDDQEVEGYGTLKLANCYKDPSMVREVLGYEVARKYFPAPLSNYANVYINGTHLGLYTSDQDVDKFFMRTHLNTDEGARLKGEIESSGPPSGSVWKYYGTDSTDYYDYYALESDAGWAELIQFLDTLNNYSDDVDQVLNVDRHLWFLAFSNLIVNLDGPINNPQNYYIFKDAADRFNTIPWDLNESFGVFSSLQNGGNLSTTQKQQLDPFLNINSSSHPVISKILSNDRYSKMYIAHMKTMIQDNFENGWYEERAEEIQDIIAADVQADQNKFYSYNDFTNNINNSVGFGPNSVIGITQLMDARVNYLLGLDYFEATQPAIADIAFSPEQPGINTELSFTSYVEDADQVFLVYRHNVSGVFAREEMFDDGNHNDEAAGDGIYGGSVYTGNAGIQYYIYAENDEAAAFMPENAEYEYYTISLTSDLVINEFMADNDTTVADQDGEYDDWIEFYNNGDSEIPLEGYYLSDDASEPDQWIFPDTTIGAGEYLIVWADDDEEQAGLHANFKLSKSGETILLSDQVLSIIDQLDFEQQATDSTTGRYPNGVGDFVQMAPTFAAENVMDLTGIEETVPDICSGINAMPNPFRNQLTLNIGLLEPSDVELKLVNLYGQEYQVPASGYYQSGTHELLIETGDLPAGIWICLLKTGSEVKTIKLIKSAN